MLLLSCCMPAAQLRAEGKPAIQHGISYNNIDQSTFKIQSYLVSEKLDGMRGYWNGKQLLSRQGNRINAPAWFTQDWPDIAIDGELWIARNTFEQLMSCVKQHSTSKSANTGCWSKVKFMIFDLPRGTTAFNQRFKQMQLIVQKTNSSYLKLVEQYTFSSIKALEDKLAQVMNQQGEGLMLHLAKATYKVGRNSALIKFKKHQDAEAVVIAHLQGKGKYQDAMGALLVEMADGLQFKIGTGFSDTERKEPPEIGSIITFKYNGKTKNGIPRFARFWRIRESNDKG